MDDEIEEGMVVDEDPQSLPGHRQADRRASGKSPYELLRESKSSVEDVVAKILAIKRQGHPKSQLRELVTQTFLHFVTLRQVNRTILLEEDRVKAETERAKAPVDFTTLQLHNLMYEKSHYIKAIKACKDFKSKYPDIELVPEEEFFRDAPEDIKGSVESNDAHSLMLKRLNFELFQRKELRKLHEQLEERKRSLLQTIANRKKFLSSLPSHLKSLKKASLPVQNQLGVLHSKKLKQHHSAELLPPPLYVVFSQLMAQKEAFEEKIDLEIIGSMKDAQTFVRQQANKDSGISSNQESSRLEDDVPDEEDDGQRRRKRPKKVPSKENLEHAGYYQVHPLKVILHIYDDETSDPKPVKLVTLKFEYMLKLNVVCVGIEAANEGPQDNILCNLFPDDTGLELPHQSAKLAGGDNLKFDVKRSSRPFKWAQHLAGIDFLPEVSPLLKAQENTSDEMSKSDVFASGLSLYRQQNRVETILQRIRSRKKAQLALVEQLDSLEKLKWPALSYKSVPWASQSPSCNLHSWSLVGYSHNQNLPMPAVEMEQLREPTEAGAYGSTDNTKDQLESVTEDGELPSLALVASVAKDVKLTPWGPSFGNSKQLRLMSKSISPITKAKSLSFKKQDDELEILLEADSDIDEPAVTEQEVASAVQVRKLAEDAWVEYGAREYRLILTRKLRTDERDVKLEAKIKISMEYPLRPPLFSLSLDSADVQWYNEPRAMEAEVNLHMLKMVPLEHENYVLAHQIHCLAMLFDHYLDGASSSSGKRDSTSIVDVGLCKPVTGSLLGRSYRGRDRRNIISWKHV
ncbi:THO complex subunit 5A [Punica granatum]|uniref:THO complex subunit 5A n=3 Tax=Punica granatum TaxID=22663 RepID=A0A6P8DI45_PUNGR|nr:THO complex subunit 5A [Punica granatum]